MPVVDSKPSFLEAISPWSVSRASTPQPERQQPVNEGESLKQTHGQDHATSHRKRLSSLRYPEDCPPLHPRWFYAVDIPKSKPAFLTSDKAETKPLPPPKKFVPFLPKDSQSIEDAFQRLIKSEDRFDATDPAGDNRTQFRNPDDTIKVPVNEDNLYDVDVDKRELSPAYWLGPVYEVRRGTWFFQDGSTLKPCEENLATQIEEGYLRLRPWQLQHTQQKVKTKKESSDDAKKKSSHSRSASESARKQPIEEESTARDGSTLSTQLPVHRLFGSYMNSTVTYQDASVAWLNSDDFMSRMSSTVYQRLGGVGGTKIVRGYMEAGQQKDPVDGKGSNTKTSTPPTLEPASTEESEVIKARQNSRLPEKIQNLDEPSEIDKRRESHEHRATLQRQISSLNGEAENVAELEEEARKQEEKEMEESRETGGEERDREIDHLVLVTHGIGQRLGLRLESVNFIHDVNVLRKTMKSVYNASPDLQALNIEYPDARRNCRVQVLPVCWRHLLDFPRQGLRQNRKEFDLADPSSLSADEEEYPTLADITLEGVPAVRNLISDLAMDVLLYQSQYREHIMGIVQQECNRIYRLFKARNPSFKGSVSLCGHSLGSAIMFDILSHQSYDNPKTLDETSKEDTTTENKGGYPLDFDCKEFFCLGSPIALFQMLKAKTIGGRRPINASNVSKGTTDEASGAKPHSRRTTSAGGYDAQPVHGQNPNVSSPRCEELYNIFHPSDPVSYRLEPLISPAMTNLKPQPLPSVKKSIWSASGQSLSNISSRVGSLWSNFTSGVASSLLNRSLGLQPEEKQAQNPRLSNDGGDGKQPHGGPGKEIEPDTPTLMSPNLETLYQGFEKARSLDKEKMSTHDMEARARKVKLEEAKVRALNSNGRVDYSIQEGAFDISLIASLASHLSYWADEDVNHFMLSQMLSRMRRRDR